MVRDRLGEFQQLACGNVGSVPNSSRVRHWSKLAPTQQSRDPANSILLERLLETVDGVAKAVAECRQSAASVADRQKRQLSVTASLAANESWPQTQQESTVLLQTMLSLKKRLDHIELELSSYGPNVINEAGRRSVLTQVNTNRKSLLDLVDSFNQQQLGFRRRKKDLLRRQLIVTGQTFDNDRLEQMLEGLAGDQIFTGDLLWRTESARQSLSAIENRFHQLRQVEVSIQQLHELFLQLSLLVAQQGESVDSIESNVCQAAISTGKGGDQLTNAARSKKLGLKTKIVCASILAVVLLILILVMIWQLS